MTSYAYHFWSKECEPCNRLKATFQLLKEDFPQFEWVSVNVKDDRNGYVTKYGVTNIPALVIDGPDGRKRYAGIDPTMYYRILSNTKV
jgi:thiol-disulfide isomerase/thioredoxin